MYAMSKQKVHLQSMQDGTCDFYVVDPIYMRCSAVSRFDGDDAGVFAATEHSVYCRDLLDFWL